MLLLYSDLSSAFEVLLFFRANESFQTFLEPRRQTHPIRQHCLQTYRDYLMDDDVDLICMFTSRQTLLLFYVIV